MLGTGTRTHLAMGSHSHASAPECGPLPADPGEPQPRLPSRPLAQRQHWAWYVACRTWMSSRGRWPRSPVRCLAQVGRRPAGGWMVPCFRTALRVPSLYERGLFTPSCSRAWGWPTRAPSPSAQGPWSPQPSYWSKVLASGDLPRPVLLPLLFPHASCRVLGNRGVSGTDPKGHG